MTDSSLTLAGAAIPKAPQELTGKRGGSRKCECFDCGECAGYFSRATIRDGRLPHCHCGAGVLVPSVLEDCADLAPDSLPRHPLAQMEQEREARAARRAHRSQGHTFQCRACKKLIPHPRAECSCGYDNGGDCYREGAAHIAPSREPRTVPPLAQMMPSTREERAQHARDAALSDSLPF